MDGGRRRHVGDVDQELAARLHDVAAGLAVGVGLLKGMGGATSTECRAGIEVLESVLADVKQLSQAPRGADIRSRGVDLAGGLREEANRLGVACELELVGDDGWLGAEERELVRLVGREALRTVKRHSGSAKCGITIDLSDCPFVLRARDPGAGIAGDAQEADGFTTLRALATALGCEFAFGSQPGLGTVLVVAGRRCPRTLNNAANGQVEYLRLRSGVAEESLGSRRRVAAQRPIPGSRQQIK